MCMRSKEYPLQVAATEACKEQVAMLLADDRRKCRNPFSSARKRFFILIAHWENDEDLVKFKPTGYYCNLYSSVQNLISDAKYMLEEKGERVTGRLWWEVNWCRMAQGFVNPLSKLALDAEGNLLGFYHDTDGPVELPRKLRKCLLADDKRLLPGSELIDRPRYFI